MSLAKGLLSKWFGSGPAENSELAPALAELEKARQARPALAASCAVLEEILPALFATPAEAASNLKSALAIERLQKRIPILRDEKVNFDLRTFKRRWLAVCKAIAHLPGGHQSSLTELPQTNPMADNVGAAFAALDPPALLNEVLAGRPEAVQGRAEALQLEASLTATVLRLTAFPILASIAGGLAELHRAHQWDQGYCPVCGSWPLLAELRGLEQNRFLRCSLCASDWHFPRLRCPFCDNRDHRQLGYFYVEGEENRCRAATCDACSGYVKTVATLAPLAGPQLLITDLVTLHLDLAAGDRGYLVR
jgi:FdhE protein